MHVTLIAANKMSLKTQANARTLSRVNHAEFCLINFINENTENKMPAFNNCTLVSQSKAQVRAHAKNTTLTQSPNRRHSW